MSLLSGCEISRCYDIGERQFVALDKISLDFCEGEFTVVTGPSGAGKSTLLQVLSGLDGPSRGRVLLRGQDIYSLSDTALSQLRNHSFGFVFQTPYMLPHKNVLDNILLPSLYAEDGADYQNRALELLDYVGLCGFNKRSPATLSGGELQRVGFARALLMSPDVIFADEPTGSLDQAASALILNMLKDQTHSGRAVVMATHDPQAMTYGVQKICLEKQ